MEFDAFEHTALPGRVVFGPGARHRVAEELDRLEVKRTLLLCSPEEEAYAVEISELLGGRLVGRCADVIQHVPEECAQQARYLPPRSCRRIQ